MILMLMVLTPFLGFAYAESTTLSLPESRVQPGGSFTISLEASPDDNVTLTLASSRGYVINYLLAAPSSGLIRTDITIPTTAEPDLYTLNVQQRNTTIANGSIKPQNSVEEKVQEIMMDYQQQQDANL